MFIQGFSVAESLFDPTIGRIINDGKSDPELIRRINSKCEGISRTLLESVSMTEKKLCVYEIEDVFKTCLLYTSIQASNYLYLNPLATTVGATIFLHEEVTPVAIGGIVLVLSGVYLATRNSRPQNSTAIKKQAD